MDTGARTLHRSSLHLELERMPVIMKAKAGRKRTAAKTKEIPKETQKETSTVIPQIKTFDITGTGPSEPPLTLRNRAV